MVIVGGTGVGTCFGTCGGSEGGAAVGGVYPPRGGKLGSIEGGSLNPGRLGGIEGGVVTLKK